MLENIQLLEQDLAPACGADEPPPIPDRGKKSPH